MSVKLGQAVPNFSLPGTGGVSWQLKDAHGRGLVIYFYPKDSTPGCTQEGQDFRDSYQDFRKAGAEIVGVSRDSLKSHENFKAKFEFPFVLLSDPDEKVCGLFDVIQEKTLYGKKYMGVDRSTFLLDAKGVLRQQWRGVKVKGHAQEVLEAVKAL